MYDEQLNDAEQDLFDTDTCEGRLTTIVLKEHESQDSELSRDVAVQRYIRTGCPSAVSLLDWMERHPAVECVSTADHNGMLCFGIPEHGISPALWLLYLAARVHELTEEDRQRFEESCSYLVLTREAQDWKRRKGASLH